VNWTSRFRLCATLATLLLVLLGGVAPTAAAPSARAPFSRSPTATTDIVVSSYGYDRPSHDAIGRATSPIPRPGTNPPTAAGRRELGPHLGVCPLIGAAEGEGVLNLPTEESWGNPSTLEDHFLRHGADFGATSAEQYAQDASTFFQQALQDGYPIKVDSDGVIRVYDPEMNTLGSYNSNGTTRTFFKPPAGPAYWARQPGSAP
jgi:hypothetical protein